VIDRIVLGLMTGLILTLTFAAPGIGRAAEAADATHRGEQVFATRCVFCHGEGLGHPAWQLLALKKGKDKAEILGRPDLTLIYVKHVVRDGFIEMPPFRASEISDPDLDALANYVIHPNPSADAKQP
jgi:mono/diheme cytochrome c family protein